MDEDTRKDGSVGAAFGKHFEQLREQRGRSREQLAKSSGVSAAEIEEVERGEVSPTLNTLRQLAGAFELPLSALFEGIDDDRISSKPFGPRLVQLRERRGWSREQLAESSGLDVDLIEQIESEQVSPRLDTVRLLAVAFDLQLSDMFEDR
jgi:transcriptional regulator with XRE-family HTH domain